MAITRKSIKLLWSNAAGRCSFLGCNERLTVGEARDYAPYTLGEMAHIMGQKSGSNRYEIRQSSVERDSYENLILLCPTHHSLIDKPENEAHYTVDMLHKMKVAHETKIANILNESKIETLNQLKDRLSILMAENHQAWEQFGPLSDNARKNPHSYAIYALWTSARLSTIVPNNRNAMKLLNENRELFARNEQRIISQFLSHVDSYEKWVNDEIPYQAVAHFPEEFEFLIFGA